MFSPFWLSVWLYKMKFFSFSSSLCICQCIIQLWNSFLAEGIFWRMCVLSTSFCSAVTQSVFREENVPCFCKQCCRHLRFVAHLGQFKHGIVRREHRLQSTWSIHFGLFNTIEHFLLLSQLIGLFVVAVLERPRAFCLCNCCLLGSCVNEHIVGERCLRLGHLMVTYKHFFSKMQRGYLV